MAESCVLSGKTYRYLLRIPDELREKLADSAARQGRSAGDSCAASAKAAIGRGSRYLRSLASMRIFLKVLYWLAVLAISIALVIGLILWFEAQDASEIEGSGRPVAPIRSA